MSQLTPKNRIRTSDIVTLLALVGTILGGLFTL